MKILVTNGQNETKVNFEVIEETTSERFFEGKLGKIKLVIKEENGVLSFVRKKSKFSEDFDQSGFEKSLAEITERKLDAIASGLDADEMDDEVESSEDHNEPYNPEDIRVETKPFSIHQIFQMMVEWNDIDLSPDFQRSFVWSDLTRRSRLIESILLRIPLPVFYFSSDKQGRMQVVDGVQRLTVIKQFLNGEFKLTNLEYLDELNGLFFPSENISKSKYKTLDPMHVRRILQTQIIVNIIDYSSPAKVKYDIFKRINTGGKPLNSQEIRNCMAKPPVRKLLQQMVEQASFKKLTIGINQSRMMDQELAMRFIGFYFLREINNNRVLSYRNDMDIFLDEVLEFLNEADFSILENIEKAFANSMTNAEYLFGEFAFKKCFRDHLTDKKRRAFLNKSLFTSWSVVLSGIPHRQIAKTYQAGSLVEKVADELTSREEYFKSVQLSTNTTKNLDIAFSYANSILKSGK